MFNVLKSLFPPKLSTTAHGQELEKTVEKGRECLVDIARHLNDYRLRAGSPISYFHLPPPLKGWIPIDAGWRARQVFLHDTPALENDRLNLFIKEGKAGSELTPHRHPQKSFVIVISGEVERTETSKVLEPHAEIMEVQPLEMFGLKAHTDCVVLAVFVPPIVVLDSHLKDCPIVRSIVTKDPLVASPSLCEYCRGAEHKCPMGVTEENKGLWLTFAGLNIEETAP